MASRKMIYPLYVHQEGESAFAGIFPDIPGCFTAADSLEELPAAAQEAVEVHFEGEREDLPRPTLLASLKEDPNYTGGFWLLVKIDPAKINAKPMRLNISLPSHLVQRIDRFAESRHMTRSRFLANAAVKAMEEAEAGT